MAWLLKWAFQDHQSDSGVKGELEALLIGPWPL